MSDRLSDDLDMIKENGELRSRIRGDSWRMLLMLVVIIFSTITKCTDVKKSYNKGLDDCMDWLMKEMKKVK